MKAYFERLGKETSWFKLFFFFFIGLAILIELGTPVIMYIFQVLIKHKVYDGPAFGYGICVSFIYSAILAGIISSNHLKEQEKTEKKTEQENKES